MVQLFNLLATKGGILRSVELSQQVMTGAFTESCSGGSQWYYLMRWCVRVVLPSSWKLNKGYKLHDDNHEYGETLPHIVIKVGGRLSGESWNQDLILSGSESKVKKLSKSQIFRRTFLCRPSHHVKPWHWVQSVQNMRSIVNSAQLSMSEFSTHKHNKTVGCTTKHVTGTRVRIVNELKLWRHGNKDELKFHALLHSWGRCALVLNAWFGP